jgi:hypothetical protein
MHETTHPRWGTIIGLSTSITVKDGRFEPREADHGIPLLGRARWSGYLAALQHGYAQRLIVVGGRESVPAAQVPADIAITCEREGDAILVPRGQAICHMLAHDHGVDARRLGHRVCAGHTGGNVEAIRAILDSGEAVPSSCCIVSSHYHLPRVAMDLHAAGLGWLPIWPAEAIWLAASGCTSCSISALAHALGGGPLAQRSVAEIKGIADKILGRYQARAEVS